MLAILTSATQHYCRFILNANIVTCLISLLPVAIKDLSTATLADVAINRCKKAIQAFIHAKQSR